MTFVVRPYRDEDQPGVRWLHDRTPPDGQVSTAPQIWPAHLDGLRDAHLAFWVAEEQAPHAGALVGMAGLLDASRPHDPPLHEVLEAHRRRLARLDSVRVAPERQRRGIGRTLTATAIEWCREQGFDALVLDTTPQQEGAVALYRACGFEERARSMFASWELVWFEYTF